MSRNCVISSGLWRTTMNYRKIYDKIIERGKNRIIEGYFETHHIIPRCLGGVDRVSNLVELTPEEHFTCHLLLVKMHPENRKLVYAAKMMAMGENTSKDNKGRKNKLYGWLRRRFIEVQKNLKHTDEAKEKIRQANLGNNHGAGNKGLKRSEQGKINMSKAAIGKVLSPESIAKREATKNANNSHKGGRPVGYVVSQETKDKIAFANKGMKRSEESKLKMSQSAQNRKRI